MWGHLQQGEFLSLTEEDLKASVVREHRTIAYPEEEFVLHIFPPVKVAIQNDFQPLICSRRHIPLTLFCERTSLFLKEGLKKVKEKKLAAYLHFIHKATVAGLSQVMFEIEATTDAGVSDDRFEDLRAVDQPPLIGQ